MTLFFPSPSIPIGAEPILLETQQSDAKQPCNLATSWQNYRVRALRLTQSVYEAGEMKIVNHRPYHKL